MTTGLRLSFFTGVGYGCNVCDYLIYLQALED